MTRIERCKFEDIPDLRRLSGFITSEYSTKYWDEALSFKRNICYTYRDKKDNIVGYILGKKEEDSTVLSVVVEPLHRREGIGSSLVDALEKEMSRRKVERLLIRVREPNCGAQEFWEELGYAYLGCVDNYYKNGDNAVHYEKHIKR